jgi:hypothetical protein
MLNNQSLEGSYSEYELPTHVIFVPVWKLGGSQQFQRLFQTKVSGTQSRR